MFQNKNIVLRASWQLLTAVSAVLVTVVLGIVSNLQSTFSVNEVTAVIALIAGVVVMVGGYVLTKRSRYEAYPTHRQTLGAVLNGVLLTVCLYVLLSVLTSSLAAGLFLFAVAGAIEFLLQRTFQARKITPYRIFAAVLLVAAVYLFGKTDPSISAVIYVFAVVFLAKELLGRYMRTYVLSPWVNSIWHGGVIALAGLATIVFFPEMSSYAASDALSMPLWAGLLVLVVGAGIIALQFFKRKIVIARGYLQHKMQLWTLLLGAVAYFTDTGLSNEMLAAFAVLVVLYSVAEVSVFPKG